MNNIITDLKTVQDYIRFAATEFSKANIYFGQGYDNAIDEARHLVLATLNLPINIPSEFYASNLTLIEKEQILNLIAQRIDENIPVAYLTQRAYFCDLEFYVNQQVLIPRSPIAELIKNKFKDFINYNPTNILDLCTGSGCIGIACAYAFPDAEVDLADISLDALEVAQINIESHQLLDRVLPISSDLFNDLPKIKYDLIITNPPYVDSEDMADLPDEFKHEPTIALTAGADGLDLVRIILKESANYLSDQGVLICEVGNSSVALIDAYPEVEFNWIEFESGVNGVFSLTKKQLIQLQNINF